MSHTSSRIYRDTQNNQGVCIADIQAVLGSNRNDIGGLISVGGAQGIINPMAKYKPVRHSALAVLNNTQRASVRYGFATPIPYHTLQGNTVPVNNWVYLYPRGKSVSGTPPTDEWYRFLDFDGYDSLAGAPLVVFAEELCYDAKSTVMLFGNEYSNAVRTDGKTWWADRSLSLQELLESNSDYYGYYISFILIDNTDSNKPRNLVVTNTTMRSFISSSYGFKEFDLYPEDTTESGLIHPGIPLFAYARRNDDFIIIAGLCPGNNPADGYAYNVVTENFPYVYSLGFVDGCDRTTAALTTGAFRMDGLTFSVSITYEDAAIEEQWDNLTWRAYIVTVRAVFDTTQAAGYAGTTMGVSGEIELVADTGFGSSPSDLDGSITRQAAASLASQTSGQDKMIFTSDSNTYLWCPKYQGSVLPQEVEATLTIDYPLTTAVTDTDSMYIPNS